LYDTRPDLFDLAVWLDDAALKKCDPSFNCQLGENLGKKPLREVREMWS